MCEYENLQAEMSDLQIKYNKLLEAHKEKCREVCHILFAVYQLYWKTMKNKLVGQALTHTIHSSCIFD